MTRVTLAGMAFLLLGVAAEGKTPQRAEDLHLQRAVDLLRRQEFAAALPELEQAQRAHPTVAEIENFLGLTTTQLGRRQVADAHYRRAIQLNPRLAGPHKNLGFNDLNESAYALAETELKAALALDAQDPFTHYYLALLYLATSRAKEAVDQLEPAAALFANDPDNEFLMAKACLVTGHTTEALALTKALADRAQLTPSQNYELALLLSSRQLYAEAALRFEYAVAAQPQSWAAKYDLALADLNAGHPDNAVHLLQAIAAEQPDNAAVLNMLGSAYEQSDNLPQALESYKSAVRVDPQNPDHYLDYTRLLMDLDRYDEAMRLVEQAIPDSKDAYALDIRLGVLRLKQARYEEARTAINQAVQLHPEILVGYVALAQSYMQQGDNAQALQLLLRARVKLPQDAALEYYVGLTSLRLGRMNDAEIALQNAARLRPEAPETHLELGKLELRTNRLHEAQAEFERVMALAPENTSAPYELSRTYARLGNSGKAAEMAAETKRLLQAQRDGALRQQQLRQQAFLPPDAAR